MTCRISLFKSIRETLKHHVASIFATSLVLFVQFLVFFLSIQNWAQEHVVHSSKDWLKNQLRRMTQPGYGYVIPIVIIAILLAFDFFRYLHSKKQVDFYESLPIRRKTWFGLRISSSFLVFLIPFTICIALEMLTLAIYGFATTTLITNLLWNYLCMIVIFLITYLTTALAMVMTGNSVIAFFGFCVFSAYAPIIFRYIYPSYAAIYFKTYVTSENETLLRYMTYLSPIGSAYKLLMGNYYSYNSVWSANDHIIDFIIIFALICLLGLLTYFLFIRRPSESAGRAMTFEKINPVIRILLVIPLTLYLGLYLSQVTSVGSIFWMIFGFVLGTILLHGIIESIFQFDIRGLWSHKKQMICCFAACIGIACIFRFDWFKYDDYLPELDELEAIAIGVDNSYYWNSEVLERNGISGEYLDDALLLAQNIVKQDLEADDENAIWIRFEYRLKNGVIKKRDYHMDLEQNLEVFDKIYATKEFKADYCSLYSSDWSKVKYVAWNDTVSSITLHMETNEMEHLFETYLAEYTELTYSQESTEAALGYFIAYDEDCNSLCYVYPQFVQTIALLDATIENDENTARYGSISEVLFDKYEIRSLEIYFDDTYVEISDLEQVNTIKDQFVLSEVFYKTDSGYDYNDYFDCNVELMTDDGIQYVSVMIPKDVAEKLRNSN